MLSVLVPRDQNVFSNRLKVVSVDISLWTGSRMFLDDGPAMAKKARRPYVLSRFHGTCSIDFAQWNGDLWLDSGDTVIGEGLRCSTLWVEHSLMF